MSTIRPTWREAIAIIDNAFSAAPNIAIPPASNGRSFLLAPDLAAYLQIPLKEALDLLEANELPCHLRSGWPTVWRDDLEQWLVRREQETAATDWQPVPTYGKYETWQPDEREYAYILIADPCSYCGRSAESVDHIVPRARSGSHSWMNFTAACRSCNARKNAHPLLTYLLRRLER